MNTPSNHFYNRTPIPEDIPGFAETSDSLDDWGQLDREGQLQLLTQIADAIITSEEFPTLFGSTVATVVEQMTKNNISVTEFRQEFIPPQSDHDNPDYIESRAHDLENAYTTMAEALKLHQKDGLPIEEIKEAYIETQKYKLAQLAEANAATRKT